MEISPSITSRSSSSSVSKPSSVVKTTPAGCDSIEVTPSDGYSSTVAELSSRNCVSTEPTPFPPSISTIAYAYSTSAISLAPGPVLSATPVSTVSPTLRKTPSAWSSETPSRNSLSSITTGWNSPSGLFSMVNVVSEPCTASSSLRLSDAV